MESFSSSVSTVSSSVENYAHNMWNPLLELLFHEQVSGIFEPFVDDIDLAKIDSLVILLLICSATKKAHLIHYDAPLGTIVHGVSLLCVAPLPLL